MKKIDKILLSIILIYIILYSFNMGGRWDLGEQIFIGFKCINTNIPLYSGTLFGKPLYNTSPYFPGVAFLSYPLKYLTNNLLIIENIMLIFSKVILFLFIYYFYKFYKILNSNTKLNFIVFLQIVFFYILISDSLFVYALEFKGDIASFALFFLFLHLVNKYNEKYFYILPFIIIISLFFKQQISILYVGLFISYVLKYFETKSNYYIKLLILLITSILIFIFLISLSESLVKHTIIALSSRDNRLEFIPFIIEIINNNKIVLFFIVMAISIYFKYFNFFKSNSNLKHYFFTIIFYFLLQTKGSLITGGNQGNFQVGLLLFLPIIIYIFEYKYSESLIIFLNLYKLTLIIYLTLLTFKYIMITKNTYLNQQNAKIVLNKYKKVIIAGDLLTISNPNEIVSDFYSYIHFKIGYYRNDPFIDNQYKLALNEADYMVFNKDYTDNYIFNLITLNNKYNLKTVDSAITRGYGKFYIYKIIK